MLSLLQNLSNTHRKLGISQSPNNTGLIPSFYHANFDENGYVFDGVKIEIEDIDNTSVSNITTQALKRCKRQVLRHYYNLLCFIGWRPFWKERYYKTPCLGTFVNIVYPLIIIILLLYSYFYDTLTCQYKLNVVTDTQIIKPFTLFPPFTYPVTKPTLAVTTTTATSMKLDEDQEGFLHQLLSSWFNKSTNTTGPDFITFHHTPKEEAVKRDEVCGHVFTTYIIPSVMHFVAYIIGFFYFRVMESEQLYALMEKVFLAVNQTTNLTSQNRVIKRLKIFLLLGALWVALAMTSQVLYRIAFGLDDLLSKDQAGLPYLITQVIALIIVNSVYLAVVINHATQAEMIIFYVKEVQTRLEEKSITLKNAMQQILDLRMAIGSLNSTVAKMTTLVSVVFTVKFIIGLIILILNRVQDPLAWSYRVMFTFTWFSILLFTVIQVTRLNSKCNKFKKIALASRIYGYHNASRDELDSFILFIANSRLRVKLFGIPLEPSYILGVLIMISLVLIVLFQSSVFTSSDSFI